MPNLTKVDPFSLAFSALVEVEGLTSHVSVIFFTDPASPAHNIADGVLEFLDQHWLSEEVWLLCPGDMENLLHLVVRDPNFAKRHAEFLQVRIRGFTFDEKGSWAEVSVAPRGLALGTPLPVNDEVARAIVQQGLRHIFVESEALVSAHGGFHFAKPGGSHAKHFLRASAAVARSAHSSLMALGILQSIELVGTRRIWSDTAGITPVAYALAHLLKRLSKVEVVPTFDSFGGYDRPEEFKQLVDKKDDLVLISSSTSGSLAQRLVDSDGIAPSRIVTLYYLSGDSDDDAGDSSPRVVCDLSQRLGTFEESLLEPFTSYTERDCELCNDGESFVTLEGDGFLPAVGTLTTRKITMKDGAGQHSELMELCIGNSVFRVNHPDGDWRKPRNRALITDLRVALSEPDGKFASHLATAIKKFVRIAQNGSTKSNLPRAGTVDLVVYASDNNSETLAEFVLNSGIVRPETQMVREQNLDSAPPDPSHVLVLAAVSSSGRSVLDINRYLRVFKESTHTSYFIAVAHPESDYSHAMFCDTLGRRGPKARNAVNVEWVLPRDAQRDEGSNPWIRETKLLEVMEQDFSDGGSSGTNSSLAHALNDRINILRDMAEEPGDKSLFIPAMFGEASSPPFPGLNKHFVFWKFEVPENAAFEEVFTTMSCAMHVNRRMGKQGQYGDDSLSSRRFVLEPAMFDRFNDPIVQACILRAARGGELDYSQDATLSRYARDLVLHALKHPADVRGASVNEFLLSLCLGHSSRFETDGDLRLTNRDLRLLLSETDAGLRTGLGVLSIAFLTVLEGLI